jgi:serine/threonine-protein kinase
MKARRSAAGLALFFCSIADLALAKPDGSVAQPSPKIAAEILFRDGVELMEQGDYAAACPKLEASEELDMAVGTLLYLADCYEQSGRLASAWARFSEARSLAHAQSMAERERIAAERVAALEPRLSRLTVVVPGARPAGFSIRLAGVAIPAASWGSALPIDPGEVELEAVAPGYEPFQTRLQITSEPGARITTVIPELEPAPEPLVFEPAPAYRPPIARVTSQVDAGKAWRAVGLTFVGVGAVGLLGGGVASLLAVRSNDESLSHCRSDGRFCTARGVELRQRAALQADIATVSIATGGGLALAGLLVYALPGSQRREVQVALTPTHGPGAMLGTRGEW